MILLNNETFKTLKSKIKKGLVRWLHLAPPCKTFSRARRRDRLARVGKLRSVQHPEGFKPYPKRRTNWHRDWLTNADHLEVLTKQCPGEPLHLHPPLAGLIQGQKLWRGSAFRQWDMQWDTSTGEATWFCNIRELRRKNWRTWRPL